MSDERSERPRRRRARRLLVAAGAALIVLLVVAAFLPRLAAPWMRARVVAALENELAVDADLAALSLSWRGAATLRGLRLTDLQRRPLIEVPELDVDLAVLALLSRELRGVGSLRGLRAHARRAADGSWDWQALPRRRPPDGPAEDEGGDERESSVRVVFDLDIADASLRVEDATRGVFDARGLAGRIELRHPDGSSRVQLGGGLLRDGAALADLRLDLRAPTGAEDPQAALAAVRGELAVDVAAFETSALESQGGELELRVEDGRARVAGTLDANGGPLTVGGDLALVPAPQAPTTWRVEARDSRARTGLAPWLARLHPAFAGLDSLSGGVLSGAIGTELELEYPGAEALSEMLAGRASFDAARLSGGGRFGISQAGLQGSPLVDRLLEWAGVAAGQKLDLEPFSFSIGSGALSYDEPWTWKLGSLVTSFAGSVHFDERLDLHWTLPLTEGFLKKRGLPKELAGRSLVLPIAGTVRDPKLDWDDALAELAKGALRDELRDEVDSLEERLREEARGLLGGEGDDDPAALLRRADELWSAGKQSEARPIYRRLREDFKLSPTYLLNRDRIKERAKDG